MSDFSRIPDSLAFQIPDFLSEPLTFEGDDGTVFILSGGSIYDILFAGGVVAGGAAIKGIWPAHSGGIVCGGTAVFEIRTGKTASGGILAGSSAVAEIRTSKTASGGIVCDGTALNSKFVAPIVASGGMVTGSSAVITSMYNFVDKSGVLAGGSAVVSGGQTISASGGVVIGKSALVSDIKSKIASGGVVIGGLSPVISGIISAGGAIIGGTAIIFNRIRKTTTGGVGAKGTSLCLKTVTSFSTGGIKVGGTSRFNVVRNPNVDGGTVVGGQTIIIDAPNIGGGIVAGGSCVVKSIFRLNSSGGIVTSGLGRQTFFDYVLGSGGFRLGGQSRIERIKYRHPIIKVNAKAGIPITPTIIIRSPQPSVPVDVNPREEVTGEWYEVENGYPGALLPRIVVINQKGYTPDPAGTVQARDRGFATATS